MTTMMTTVYLPASLTGITVAVGVGIFLSITLLLVAILLIAKSFLVHRGNGSVKVNIDRAVEVSSGESLLSAMASWNIFLPSACGG